MALVFQNALVLTTNDATTAAGKTLYVDGSALGSGDSLNVSVSASVLLYEARARKANW